MVINLYKVFLHVMVIVSLSIMYSNLSTIITYKFIIGAVLFWYYLRLLFINRHI
jgi:hypothetical protein